VTSAMDRSMGPALPPFGAGATSLHVPTPDVHRAAILERSRQCPRGLRQGLDEQLRANSTGTLHNTVPPAYRTLDPEGVVCSTTRGMPFAIVDREREGTSAVLMIVDEQADAETIAIELRQANGSVDVLPVTASAQRVL